MFRFALPAALLAGPAFADANGFTHMTDYGYGYGYGTGMMFAPVLWLLILGLIVAGIVWMVQRPNTAPTNSNAAAMLDMRLAKGEIDAEEYAARKKLLAD